MAKVNIAIMLYSIKQHSLFCLFVCSKNKIKLFEYIKNKILFLILKINIVFKIIFIFYNQACLNNVKTKIKTIKTICFLFWI